MKRIVLALVLLITTAGMAQSQCKGLTKKKCLPDLKPYNSSGKMNSAVMRPGDKAEVIITFNSEIDYRIFLCKSGDLNVYFKVMDTDRNVFFDSKNSKKSFFDFNVASTQQLIVEIICEDKESLTGLVPEGCVSILTGYKSKK